MLSKSHMSQARNGIRRIHATACPVQAVLSRIGDKWSGLVIFNLGGRDDMRFSELQRAIAGISKRMLSSTLQNLEYDGLVRRVVLGTHPPEVRYSLTDLGRSLCDPIKELADWAVTNAAAMASARRRYEEDVTSRARTPWQS